MVLEVLLGLLKASFAAVAAAVSCPYSHPQDGENFGDAQPHGPLLLSAAGQKPTDSVDLEAGGDCTNVFESLGTILRLMTAESYLPLSFKHLPQSRAFLGTFHKEPQQTGLIQYSSVPVEVESSPARNKTRRALQETKATLKTLQSLLGHHAMTSLMHALEVASAY